jgi:putative ABC transport system permease protein
MLYALMIMMALPGLIAMINTLAISVIERTREIGLLRAVGSTRRQVRRMIMVESLLLAIAGIGFGILAGIFLGYAFISALSVTGYGLRFLFPYQGVLVALASGLIIGVLAAGVPARQAAQMNVVKALQYE